MGTLAPGTRLGVYEVIRPIGVGGMGVVYRATHIDLKRDVAIKTIRPERTEDENALARFVHEGQAAARVRHPNVVDVYDIGTYNNLVYLVMEYLEGCRLADHLEAQGQLSVEETASILLPVAAALACAHQRGVIHRDVKPSNIFLCRGAGGECIPKVLDFGISKIYSRGLIHETISEPGALLGSLPYLAPEQASSSGAVDARSDQYSLGVVVYLCATGRHPFGVASPYSALWKIVKGEYESVRKVAPYLPEHLLLLIETAMATDPSARYPSMEVFAQSLLPIADETTASRWRPIFEEMPATTVTENEVEAIDDRLQDSAAVSVMSRAPKVSSAWPLVLVLSLLSAAVAALLLFRQDANLSRTAAESTREPPPRVLASPVMPQPATTTSTRVDGLQPDASTQPTMPVPAVERLLSPRIPPDDRKRQRRPRRRAPSRTTRSDESPIKVGPNRAPILPPE